MTASGASPPSPGSVVATHAGIDGYDALVQMWEPGVAESSLFRSPLRNVVTKGRAVCDFYGAAVCHKIFERFPGLRMASVENGAMWVPDLLHRLDDAANRNPEFFHHHPQRRVRRARLGDPVLGGRCGELLGDVRVDRLLMGSDWPHAEGTRQPIDFVGETLSGVPDDAVDASDGTMQRTCSDLASTDASQRDGRTP